MARKPTRVITEDAEEVIDKDEVERKAAEEIQKQQTTEEWLADFQSRFTEEAVKILIEKHEDGEWKICRKYPLSNFDHESVRDEFGGGRYRATLYDPNGKYVVGGRNNFTFAAPAQKKDTEHKPTDPFSNPGVMMVIEQIRAQAAQATQLLQTVLASQQGNKGGIGELVEAMKGLQALTPRDTSKPLDGLKDLLGVQKLLKEVNGNGDSDSKEGLLSDIKQIIELAPLIREAIPALKAGLPQSSNPIATNPRPPLSSAPIPTPGGPQQLNPLSKKIVELMPRFVLAGKNNEPIQQWSDHLLDVMEKEIMPILLPDMKATYGPIVQNEDDAYDILIKYAQDETTRDKIYVTILPLAPYKAWCNQVIARAVKDLTGDENGANVVIDAVNGPGNGAEAQPN